MRRTGEPEMQKCEISRFFYRKREISEISGTYRFSVLLVKIVALCFTMFSIKS